MGFLLPYTHYHERTRGRARARARRHIWCMPPEDPRSARCLFGSDCFCSFLSCCTHSCCLCLYFFLCQHCDAVFLCLLQYTFALFLCLPPRKFKVLLFFLLSVAHTSLQTLCFLCSHVPSAPCFLRTQLPGQRLRLDAASPAVVV